MKTVLSIAMVLACAAGAQATITYTTGTYTQDFDTLPSSGTNPLVWANDDTLNGWYLFNTAGAAITGIRQGAGTETNGAFYSFGAASNSERALGGIGSSGHSGFIAMAITNGTAAAFTEFTLNFDGEQWRNGGNTTAQTMGIAYGFGNTFGAVSTWTPLPAAFAFTSTTNTATAAALNGNAAANRTAGLGGTVSDLNWAAGQTLWVRWIELNDGGNDHALAIDNVSFTVPAPGSVALIGIGGLIAARRRRA